jgi:prepilin-type processing-associated H-X9-DG protein
MTIDQPDEQPEAPSGPRFTLLSLFVLTACAAAVLGLFLPAVRSARDATRRMQCSNNLKQLALGVWNYESTFKVLPASFRPHSQLSWTIGLEPFLEASSRFNSISQDAGPFYAAGKNDPMGSIDLPYHHCPSSDVIRMETKPPSDVSLLDLVPINTGVPSYTLHYYGINGAVGKLPDGSGEYELASPLMFEDSPIAGNGVFQWNTIVRVKMISDGTSNTLLFGEMSWESPKYGTRYRSWMHGGTDGSYIAGCRNIVRPINAHKKGAVLVPFNNMPMGSQHTGGANFAICDGSVRFIQEKVDMAIYQALATRDGQEEP